MVDYGGGAGEARVRMSRIGRGGRARAGDELGRAVREADRVHERLGASLPHGGRVRARRLGRSPAQPDGERGRRHRSRVGAGRTADRLRPRRRPVRDGRDGRSAAAADADADGEHAQQLTHEEAGAEDPAWSPDGLRLAGSSGGVVFTITLDGANLQRVPPAQDDDPGDTEPAWSPDGRRVAFSRSIWALGTSAIWVA